MKGFKPTGYGPRNGFDFPASFGFTGSTGTTTNVRPHVRRYASGGAVRAGKMKTEHPGTPGHATVQRTRPSTALDQAAGGRTPLRPGFKRGGRADGGKVVRTRLPDGTPSFRRKQSLLEDLKESVRSAAQLASPAPLKHRSRKIESHTNYAAGGYAGGGLKKK